MIVHALHYSAALMLAVEWWQWWQWWQYSGCELPGHQILRQPADGHNSLLIQVFWGSAIRQVHGMFRL